MTQPAPKPLPQAPSVRLCPRCIKSPRSYKPKLRRDALGDLSCWHCGYVKYPA